MQNLIKELNQELKRLQQKYATGFNIEIVYRPTDVAFRPRITCPDGKRLVVNGEWKKNRIFIYNNEDPIHTLHHEFVEKFLLEHLVDGYVILSNMWQNVFRTLMYRDQEEQIEILARLEDEEYFKIKQEKKR